VDYLRFLDQAYGSVRELEYQLSLAARLGFLADESAATLDPMCQETGKVLHGLIRSMRSVSRPAQTDPRPKAAPLEAPKDYSNPGNGAYR